MLCKCNEKQPQDTQSGHTSHYYSGRRYFFVFYTFFIGRFAANKSEERRDVYLATLMPMRRRCNPGAWIRQFGLIRMAPGAARRWGIGLAESNPQAGESGEMFGTAGPSMIRRTSEASALGLKGLVT